MDNLPPALDTLNLCNIATNIVYQYRYLRLANLPYYLASYDIAGVEKRAAPHYKIITTATFSRFNYGNYTHISSFDYINSSDMYMSLKCKSLWINNLYSIYDYVPQSVTHTLICTNKKYTYSDNLPINLAGASDNFDIIPLGSYKYDPFHGNPRNLPVQYAT
jgi:hypothetical protein